MCKMYKWQIIYSIKHSINGNDTSIELRVAFAATKLIVVDVKVVLWQNTLHAMPLTDEINTICHTTD